MEYIFCQHDFYTGQGDYALCGNEYRVLLEHCVKYCSIFCFRVYPGETNERWRKYMEPYLTSARFPFECDISDDPQVVQGEYYWFQCTPESVAALRCIEDNLFDMQVTKKNPEDIIFFRPDDSLFLYAETDEGECVLYPLETEDVSAVLQNPHWIEFDEYERWHGHSLPEKI